MRFVGRLEEWNDDRGFGFVTPNGGGARAFVHIKAFEQRARRPAVGDLISYRPKPDALQRLNALQVRFVETTSPVQSRRKDWFPRKMAGGFFLAVVVAAAYLGKLPPFVALIYVAMSVITFFAYWLDKSAARANRWRTRENTLHVLALLGGWPGALIAQGRFRHKVRKESFLMAFWLTLVTNLVVVAWLLHTGKADSVIPWFLSIVSGAAVH